MRRQSMRRETVRRATIRRRTRTLGFTRLLLLAGALPFAIGSSLGIQPSWGAPTQGGVINISADLMSSNDDTRQYTASGNVILEFTNGKINADKMTVQQAASGALDWARCENNVKFERSDPEAKTSLKGVCKTLDYYESQRKAIFLGGVKMDLSTPKLDEPARITGSRIEMDLTTEENRVLGSAGEQARVKIKPRQADAATPAEPVDLTADLIVMNNKTQQYVATGSPLLVRPTARLKAKEIKFELDPTGTDLRKASGNGDVVFDSKHPTGALMHATADNAVFESQTNMVTLTGHVVASRTRPNDERPTVTQCEEFRYNLKTREGAALKAKSIVPENALPGRPGEVKKPQ